MLPASSILKSLISFFFPPSKTEWLLFACWSVMLNWRCCAGFSVAWPLDAELPQRAVAEVHGFLQDFLKGMNLVRNSHGCFFFQFWHYLILGGPCMVQGLRRPAEHRSTLNFPWLQGWVGITIPSMGRVACKAGGPYAGELSVCYLEPFLICGLLPSACRWRGGHLMPFSKGGVGSCLGKWILQPEVLPDMQPTLALF